MVGRLPGAPGTATVGRGRALCLAGAVANRPTGGARHVRPRDHVPRPPEGVDAGLRDFREWVLPALQGMAGFAGAYVLVDRGSGMMVAVGLWETAEAMQASAAAVAQLRVRGATARGVTEPPTVEEYEVAAHPGAEAGVPGRVVPGNVGSLDDVPADAAGAAADEG